MTKYLPYYKRNLKLAFPVILSQAGQVIVQQIDTMMVGYIGSLELAASAFANSVFMVGMIVVMGFTFGLTPAVGQAISHNNQKYLNRLLSNSYLANISFAILVSLLLYGSSFLFQHMGQEATVVSTSKPYFYTLTLSLLPLIIFMTHKQFAEGVGNTKTAMYVTIVSNVLNIILNYILIFGKLGAPQMGLLGAGIATLISRVFMAISFIVIFKKSTLFNIYFNHLKLIRINKPLMKKLFSLGMPISMQMLLEILAFGLSAIMAGWLGIIPLAAHQIAIGLASITFMIVVGVGSATTIRVSHQYSHKDFNGLIMAAKASIHIVLVFMSFTALLFLVFRNHLPLFYSQDQDVITVATQLLIVTAVFQLFDGLQVVTLSILRGLGDVNHAMRYAFIAYILINLPLGYILGFVFELGVLGIWIGFIIGLGSAALLFLWRFRLLYKKLAIS